MDDIYITQYINTMAKRIKLNEAQLKKLVREAVLGEIDDETYKKARKTMAQRYRQMFISRVQNAAHGSFGEVERTVQEFYNQFKDKIDNENFTLENLMDMAERIENGEIHVHGNPGAGRQGYADGFWGGNWGKKMEEGKKSRLNKIISESIRKALREATHKSWNAMAETYIRGYDGFVDELENTGVLNPEEAEKLYQDLMGIFENIKVQGRFNAWSYPQTYEDPGDEGCELQEIDVDKVWEAVENLQWPTDIIVKVQEFIENWEEEEMNNNSDGEGWEFYDYDPYDDRDPNDYDERYN